jgi:flagellar hook-length control protein FliK
MQADSAATRDVLQHQLTKLRDSLQERGVRTGSLDVGDHSDRAATQGRETDEHDASSSGTSHAESDSTPQPVAAQQSAAANTPNTSTSGRLDLHV